MRILTSWDDGVKEDLKVIKLLKKYNLPGIFFIPIESWGFKNLEKYKDFEIGCHTYSHPPDLKKCDDPTLIHEIWEARSMIKYADYPFEKPIWFCYPRGRYDKRIIQEVKDAGFKYARTTKIGIANKDTYPYEVPGFHCFQRREYYGKDWLEAIKEEINTFSKMKRNPEVHIWGHSWEIEKNKEWDKLEKLFKHLNENSDC